MKSTKDFRSQDTAHDNLRRAAKLEPIRKSGKEKHQIYRDVSHGDDSDDDELLAPPKRESVLDYFDDDDE